MRKLLKHGLCWCIGVSRLHKVLERSLGGMGIILMFHRVLPSQYRSHLSFNRNIEISPETLEKIIDYFTDEGFDFVTLSECRERIIQRHAGRRCVVFTFDDGYLDNYTHAYPILKKRAVPFVVYVASGFPDRKMPTWWYALEQLIIERDRVSFTLDDTKSNFPCSTSEEMQAAYSEIHKLILTSTSVADYNRLLDAIFSDWDGDVCNCQGASPMSWEHIQELSNDELIEFGAHTVSHVPLTCQTEECSRQEIFQSKVDLENRIGTQIRHFAYPYGMFRKKDREIVNELGFLTATTTWPGNLHHNHRQVFDALPRLAVTDDVFMGNYLDLVASGVRPFIDNSFAKVMSFD